MSNTQDQNATRILSQLVDELKLHAWLASAEVRNPSAKHPETRNEIDALVRVRDELRVQMHLGKLEAREEFERIEGRWQKLKQAASRGAEDLEDSFVDVLGQIRDAYAALRPKSITAD